jgi:O-antigen/teichoic acid export membrane protein
VAIRLHPRLPAIDPAAPNSKLSAAAALDRLGPRSRYALLSFGGQGVVYLATFVTALIIARVLGPEGKGEYTAWTLVTLFASLLLAGPISTGLGRAYLRDERDTIAANALAHGALALAGALALGAVALALGFDPLLVVTFIVVAVPANVIVLDLLVVFQAAKTPLRYQGVRALKAVVIAAGLGLVVLFAREETREWAFALWAAGTVAGATVALWMVGRIYGRRRGSRLREVGRLGRGSTTTNVVDWMLLRVDQFIVVGIAGSFQLGIYSVAVNFAEVALYAGQSVGLGLFEDERTLSRADTGRLLRKVMAVAVAITVGVVVAGLLLVEPLFGSAFADARLPLLLLAPGIAARGVAFAGAQILLARGQGGPLGRLMGAILVVALAATALGTVLYGIEGAAAASSLAYVLQGALVVRLLFRGANRPR